VIWVVSRHGHPAIMQQSPCGDYQPGRRPGAVGGRPRGSHCRSERRPAIPLPR